MESLTFTDVEWPGHYEGAPVAAHGLAEGILNMTVAPVRGQYVEPLIERDITFGCLPNLKFISPIADDHNHLEVPPLSLDELSPELFDSSSSSFSMKSSSFQEFESPKFPMTSPTSTQFDPLSFSTSSPGLPGFESLTFSPPLPELGSFSLSEVEPMRESSTLTMEAMDFMLTSPAINEEMVALSPLLLEEEMKLPSTTMVEVAKEPTQMPNGEELVFSLQVMVEPEVEAPLSMVEAEKQASPPVFEAKMTLPSVVMIDVEDEASKWQQWTEDEHRLFLNGIDTFGRGAWTCISKNSVITRSSSQVASHAQKFFIKQRGIRKKSRPSILDIMSVRSPSLIKKKHIFSLHNIAHLNKSFTLPSIDNVYEPNKSTISPMHVKNSPKFTAPNATLGVSQACISNASHSTTPDVAAKEVEVLPLAPAQPLDSSNKGKNKVSYDSYAPGSSGMSNF